MKISGPPPIRRRSVAAEAFGATVGGVTLGAPAAALGYQVGERYGMRVIQSAIPHALKLLQHGWLSPTTALNVAQYALRPVVQAQVGALCLGTVGLLVGTMAGAAVAESLIRE